MSDLNDTWPHDDHDVIAVSKHKEVARVPADKIAVVDLDRIAANLMRDGYADGRGVGLVALQNRGVIMVDDGDPLGVATNVPPPPSSASRDLAMVPMFDLDRNER